MAVPVPNFRPDAKLRARNRLRPPMAVPVPDYCLRPLMAVPVPNSRPGAKLRARNWLHPPMPKPLPDYCLPPRISLGGRLRAAVTAEALSRSRSQQKNKQEHCRRKRSAENSRVAKQR